MEMNEDIRLLQRLVAIPSVSGAEQAMGDAVEAEFRNMGLEVERYEIGNGRPVVLGILRGGRPGPALLFDGHTDTHPVEDYLGDPFEPRIENGRLYGRGAVDMKGGLAAMMRAAGRLKSCREKLAGSLIVAAVPDEELLSQGTAFLAELGVKAQAGIVGEPTGLKIGRAMRGVTHIDLTVTGTPKHTSSWSGDENAIVQMGKILAALDRELPERYGRRRHELLGTPLFNVGLIRGGEKPNVVAQGCTATLLRRDLPGEVQKQVFGELLEIAEKAASGACKVRVEESPIQRRPGGGKRLPMEVERGNRIVEVLKESTRQVTGAEAEDGMVPFWCDASILTNEAGIPTVVFGPGDIACAHSREEWIDLGQYRDCIEIYERAVLGFLG